MRSTHLAYTPLVAALFGASVYAQTIYSVTDLVPPPPHFQTGAWAINDAGQVAGFRHNPTEAALWNWVTGQRADLGWLPGDDRSEAFGINSLGHVVGRSRYITGDLPYHAFVYRNGEMIDLGLLPGGFFSQAFGINTSGQIVGVADGDAFLYSGGVMTDLQTSAAASAINDSGQIAGFMNVGGGAYHAFLYNNGQITDLGTLGGANSEATAINASGQIAGAADLATGATHAVLYSDGGIRDLGVLPGMNYSKALGINASGQVVGISCLDFTTGCVPFQWKNGVMQGLNDLIPPDSPWGLILGNGINAAGQIVGQGLLGTQLHGYVLTPPVVFNDVPLYHPFFVYVNELAENHITTGCSPTPPLFCPDGVTTRGQMAAFIIRAKFGEEFSFSTTPYFTDVPDRHPLFKYVQKMRDEGITSGCTPTLYCPDSNVTRGEMAVFIIRAKFTDTFDSPSNPFFTDVPATHPFFRYVQKMREQGITSGCSPTQYCPDNPVNRGQMAVFIARAFLGLR
jgi:probable HAF family extracellular repeat protein